jgi:hypothetical protein
MKFHVIVTSILGMCALLLAGCPAHQGPATKDSQDQASQPTKAEKPQQETNDSLRIIVKPFELKGVEAEYAGGLESKFCHELARNKRLEVVCASDLKAIAKVKQQQMLLGQCADEECMANFSKIFKADRVLLVKIGKVGETFVSEACLFEGASGKAGKRYSNEKAGAKVEDLLTVMADLAAQVNAGI